MLTFNPSVSPPLKKAPTPKFAAGSFHAERDEVDAIEETDDKLTVQNKQVKMEAVIKAAKEYRAAYPEGTEYHTKWQERMNQYTEKLQNGVKRWLDKNK